MKLPNIVFSSWARWADRTAIDNIDAPGIYILAQFKKQPAGNAEPQVQDIIYIGETCNQTLKKRWGSFHRAAFQGRKGIHK